ncbi:MAG: XRE family transcriptional regulator [bacterium]
MDKIFKEIGFLIKKRREELGFTQIKLAELIGVTPLTIQRYEYGNNRIKIDYLKKIAEIFKNDISYFFAKSEFIVNKIEDKTTFSITPVISSCDEISIDMSKYQSVPIYSFAGTGKFIGLTETKPIDTLFVPKEFSSLSIGAFKVTDNSMEPIIKDGSYIGVDMNDKEPIPGYIYCAYLSNYGGALIRYVIIENPEGITLKPKNQTFDNITVSRKELEDKHSYIIGKVKWVWQDI